MFFFSPDYFKPLPELRLTYCPTYHSKILVKPSVSQKNAFEKVQENINDFVQDSMC